MFDWIPILNGKYFTAEQYLILIILISLLITRIRILQDIALLSLSWFGYKINMMILIAINYKSIKKIIFLFIIYILTYDVCFAMHNIEQGYFFNYDGVAFSTAFTRYFQQNNHFRSYITLTQNQNQIIFNFLTQQNDNYIVYCNREKHFIITNQLYDRFIHHVIINITQNNNIIQIILNNQLIQQYNFINFNETQITIIDGGDSGYTETSKKIWQQMQKIENIDVINIGGDVAYDNGFITCISCWDKFLELYEQLCQQQNKLIPIILSIGNHDVGRVTNPFIIFDNQYGNNVPNIFQMFPQYLINQQIPTINNRRSYFVHPIGPINFITLDSGYMTSAAEQKEFFNQSLINGINLVSYHVPIVPLQQNDEEFVFQLANLLNQVDIVFEHHKHNFKRTEQSRIYIENQKIKLFPGKTYYVGNGAMGIQSGKQVEHQLIVKSNRKAHFWVYIYENGKQILKAIDQYGSQFDYVEIYK